MAQSNNIRNHWNLIAFAQEHGKMQVGKFSNGETGEDFKSCIFTKTTADGKQERTFVHFSSKMGELTAKEIAAAKDDLQVVQLDDTGNYVLCKVGSDAWEDVDLGI